MRTANLVLSFGEQLTHKRTASNAHTCADMAVSGGVIRDQASGVQLFLHGSVTSTSSLPGSGFSSLGRALGGFVDPFFLFVFCRMLFSMHHLYGCVNVRSMHSGYAPMLSYSIDALTFLVLGYRLICASCSRTRARFSLVPALVDSFLHHLCVLFVQRVRLAHGNQPT